MNLLTILRTELARKHDWGKLKHKCSVIVPEHIKPLLTIGPFDFCYGVSRMCNWSTELHEFHFERRSLRLNIHFHGHRNFGIGIVWDTELSQFAPETSVELKADTHIGGPRA